MRSTLLIGIYLALTCNSFAMSDIWPPIFLTEKPIEGKLEKKISGTNHLYILLKTTTGKIWVATQDEKYVIGKTYRLYPPYLEEEDYKDANVKFKAKRILYSIGIQKNIDYRKYSFKTIEIGMPIETVKSKLQELGLEPNISNENQLTGKIETFEIEKFPIGDHLFNLRFVSDYHGKLAAYSIFTKFQDPPAERDEILYFSRYLLGVFKKKYGKATPLLSHDDIDMYGNRNTLYEWENSDIKININYSFTGDCGELIGTISSQTRFLQTFNALSVMGEKMKKELLNEWDEYTGEGASSF